MERGLTRVRAPDGSYPYEQFEIEASADVFLTLTQEIDGVESALDVSSSSVVVKLRGKARNATTLPIDTTMTKRTGTTNPGDTGKVSATVRLSPDYFDAGDFGIMGCYIIDTATQDTPTPSGYKETLWGGLWEFVAIDKIDGAGI